jgi:intergrase/recombinase
MKDPARKRKTLLTKLDQCSQFVRGSITSVCATCNRARCICQKKLSSPRAYRLTYKDSRQKTRIVYIPRDRLPRMRKMIANYARVRKLVEQLIETNIEEFKKKGRR